MTSSYDQQAIDFIAKTGITIRKEYTGRKKHFSSDTKARDTYLITLSRLGKSDVSFDFGDSLHNTELRAMKSGNTFLAPPKEAKEIRRKWEERATIKDGPTDYNILACISADSYCPDNFQEFCDSYGYDTDSRSALDIYLKCQEISSKIKRFFTHEEMEILSTIQ